MLALGHSHPKTECALHTKSSHAGIGETFKKTQTPTDKIEKEKKK